MGIYERFTREESPVLPVHVLSGLLGELERGKLTDQQAIDALATTNADGSPRPLTAEEITELAALKALIQPRWESICMSGQVTLTNVGTTFDATNPSQGLPAVRVHVTGVTAIHFDVRVNKVGTGTQEWQLWNDTNGNQVALIQDAGAAGIKTLSSGQIDFDPALTGGFKMIRVRARSTTAADDPVFFTASLAIRRVSVLTALELHEVLLIAEHRASSPYATATALKARLGVS